MALNEAHGDPLPSFTRHQVVFSETVLRFPSRLLKLQSHTGKDRSPNFLQPLKTFVQQLVVRSRRKVFFGVGKRLSLVRWSAIGCYRFWCCGRRILQLPRKPYESKLVGRTFFWSSLMRDGPLLTKSEYELMIAGRSDITLKLWILSFSAMSPRSTENF